MKIKINGCAYDAEEGQTILDVARKNGVYIPSLCYHAKIGALGRCRACVVEIGGAAGLHTACSTLAAEGMTVVTNSRRVLESQKLVVAFLFSAGIHNCANCARYADCELKQAAHYLGLELDMTGPDLYSPLVTWFEAPYWNEAHGLSSNPADPTAVRHLDITLSIDDSSEYMQVSRDKCVLCGLCIEACRRAGRHVIHFARRGYKTKIIFDNDVPLGASNCDQCGECVKVCPTAALVPKTIVDSSHPQALRSPDNRRPEKTSGI